MSTLPAPLSADFSLLPGFLSAADADAAFNAVLEETQWEVHHFKLFGKIIEMPRRIAYAGHKAYSYSGVLHSATPMTAMATPATMAKPICAAFFKEIGWCTKAYWFRVLYPEGAI